jgi:hypothetical protein
VHDPAPLLKFFGPRNRATGSARLFRLARVYDQLAALEEGDRGGCGLLSCSAGSRRPQEGPHPAHGQEDAIFPFDCWMLSLPAAKPDVQAERVDGCPLALV